MCLCVRSGWEIVQYVFAIWLVVSSSSHAHAQTITNWLKPNKQVHKNVYNVIYIYKYVLCPNWVMTPTTSTINYTVFGMKITTIIGTRKKFEMGKRFSYFVGHHSVERASISKNQFEQKKSNTQRAIQFKPFGMLDLSLIYKIYVYGMCTAPHRTSPHLTAPQQYIYFCVIKVSFYSVVKCEQFFSTGMCFDLLM